MDSKTFRIETEFDVAKIVLEASKIAKEIGFNKSKQNIIATVVSELGNNIIRHAQRGNITLSMITEGLIKGVEIIAKDNGPGIEDISKALTNYYSTKNSLGLGLPAVKRLMDDLTIDSEKGKGTLIIAKKWI